MIETDEDRAIFVEADEFGVVARVELNTGDAFDVAGIFDDRPVTGNPGYAGAALSGSGPTFTAISSAVAAVKVGRATLTINGKTYGVHDLKPDGTGMTLIRLMKA